MGETTAIAWTDHTFNPWWGCVNVSPGCDNCYAEAFAKRTGHAVWGKDHGRRFFGEKHWAEPLKWEGRVFCASMADVFEPNDRLCAERERLWRLIDSTPHLTWQLLTKRPEQVPHLAPALWLENWPTNVWLGTTVEDQERAELRIPRLLKVPGVSVRFLSCEPLLEPVDLSRWLYIEWGDALRTPGTPESFRGEGGWGVEMVAAVRGQVPGIGWVICGGESGPHHRPMDPAWARDLRDQCQAAGVPFFFKQVGGRTPTAGGDELDGQRYKEFPMVQVAA